MFKPRVNTQWILHVLKHLCSHLTYTKTVVAPHANIVMCCHFKYWHYLRNVRSQKAMKGGVLFKNDCFLVKDKIYEEWGHKYFTMMQLFVKDESRKVTCYHVSDKEKCSFFSVEFSYLAVTYFFILRAIFRKKQIHLQGCLYYWKVFLSKLKLQMRKLTSYNRGRIVLKISPVPPFNVGDTSAIDGHEFLPQHWTGGKEEFFQHLRPRL